MTGKRPGVQFAGKDVQGAFETECLLSVDLVRRIVTVRGKEVKFSPREYEVLRLMVAHAGKVLTHRFMVREIWGNDSDVQYLRIYMRSLRHKIEASAKRPCHILTETGVGYRLRKPD